MNRFINTLTENILGKQAKDCHSEELKALSAKYPFASALQLLYGQKLVEEKQENRDIQLQKTLLYFNNPLLISFLIRNSDREIQPVNITPAASTNPTEGSTDDLPPLPEFKIEAIDPSVAQLSFTPYHTIDYFAAQGIKFSEEQQSPDRFGSQLKSFTAWLKQMKRLPGASKNTAMTAFEEKNIEQMAAISVKGENALTEAMAEVWEKQGDLSKAINIYQKLSLQIPAKSAYFAAKIDHLKKQI